MRAVDIKVYNIGRTALDREECRRWLTDEGVSQDAIDRLLTSDNTDCENLVRLAGKRCYRAFEVGHNPNISRVREDIAKYIDHILESRHGSVIEHVNYTFAIEGISRVCTGELNRHRAGVAISEGSMRFIRFTDIPFWMPNSIREDVNDTEEIAAKKAQTRHVFFRAFQQAEENYSELQGIWKEELDEKSKFSKKKEITSLIRRPIPIGVATGGVWTFNFRALRHVCTMRADPAAEEEINHLAVLLLENLLRSELHFFGDFQKDEKGFYRPKHWKV